MPPAYLNGSSDQALGVTHEFGISGCTGKQRHATQGQAIRASKRAAKRPSQRDEPMRFYLCPHCHGWHLTSVSKEESAVISREKRKR